MPIIDSGGYTLYVNASSAGQLHFKLPVTLPPLEVGSDAIEPSPVSW
jgi:hypothetical protein